VAVTELLPTLQELSRADKLRVMEFLAQDLVREEESTPRGVEAYPVWSPYGAHDAAETLLKMLDARVGTDGGC